MAKMTGLGKGLDALFSESPLSIEKEEIQEGESIQKLKIIEIEPNRNQPRRNFDSESLEELATSIKTYGILQPIIVTKKKNYFEIIAGERRWRAAKIAGITEIPVIIREDDGRKNQEISLIENIQRADLNPIEKAKGYRTLMDEYGLTQMQLSETIGINRSTIANTVRILNLDPRVLEFVSEGKLTEGHCKALLAITDGDKQFEMAKRMIERGATVREVEQKVSVKKQLKNKDARYEAIFRDIEDSFQSFFGTKVRLDAGKKKGKIVIEYNSNDDLERILELIKEENR